MGQINRTQRALDDYFSYCTEMAFIAGKGGEILQVSRELARAFGPALHEEAMQAGLAPLAHPDDRRAFDEAWERLGAAPERVSIDVRLKTEGGSFKLFRCAARWVPEREEVYATLHDAEPLLKDEIKLRILQAINENLPVVIWAIDARGFFVIHDGKGLEGTTLKPGALLGLNYFDRYDEKVTRDMREALSGKTSRMLANNFGRHWEAWLMPVRNERGEVTHVAGVSLDVTGATRTEQELRSKLELIQAQQQVIRSLSTPIIQVWDRVLTLPLVGMFDSARAAEVMDNVLREVVATRARYAILDLTGIEAMDTATATHLLKLAQAVRLLGAEGIITGIHPAIAQTMTGLGVDLTSIVTRSTLREGLQHCIQTMSHGAR